MIELSVQTTLHAASGVLSLRVDTMIESGSLVTLYGPSGAGKTTLLRILAGLFNPEEGRIVVNGVSWLDTRQKINLPPQQRSVGLVFQDYALFPHLTVRENLRFALPKGQDSKVIAELMEAIDLEALQHRKPGTLSGGQQQRVALARALVQRPSLLLLDEPLSALDHTMRRRLQQYLLDAHRAYGLTTLLVSHDVSEILHLSSRMLVLEEGQLVRQGPPAEVLTHREVSGKVQFVGEVMTVERQDFLGILTILIGQELVRVVVDEREADTLRAGDRVLVASKAWNPMVRKIE